MIFFSLSLSLFWRWLYRWQSWKWTPRRIVPVNCEHFLNIMERFAFGGRRMHYHWITLCLLLFCCWTAMSQSSHRRKSQYNHRSIYLACVHVCVCVCVCVSVCARVYFAWFELDLIRSLCLVIGIKSTFTRCVQDIRNHENEYMALLCSQFWGLG